MARPNWRPPALPHITRCATAIRVYGITGAVPATAGAAEYGVAPIPPGAVGIVGGDMRAGGNGAVVIPVTAFGPSDACVSGGGLDQSILGFGKAVAVGGSGVVSEVIT